MKRITLSVLPFVPLLAVGCWDGVSGLGGASTRTRQPAVLERSR